MNRRTALALLTVCLLILLLTSCSQAKTPASPTIALSPTRAATLAPEPTHTPTPTPTDTPRPTLTATHTPAPTATSTPTATPQPVVSILVVDKETGQPIEGAAVHLSKTRVGFDADQNTDAHGRAVFAGVRRSNWAYQLTVAASGYHQAATDIIVELGENDWTVSLTPGVFAHVTADGVALRTGPGSVYGWVAEVKQGDVLTIVGQSADGAWLVVETGAGETGWLTADSVQVEGDLNRAVAMVAPPTPTPTPIPPTPTATLPPAPPAPPPAAPPTGGNLVVNPGFEEGTTGWKSSLESAPFIYSSSQYPQFIRSGDKAAAYFVYQLVHNTTPGVNYRLGVWGRSWSSSEEDRSVSKDPGDIEMYICIDPTGNRTFRPEASICSASANPLDTWHYFTVDAVARSDAITIILTFVIHSGPLHSEVLWDDVSVGLSPVSAVPTPTPPPPPSAPVRPAPVPFDGVALRDSMVHLQWVLEQMGGLLDRVYNGEYGSCPEFESYYHQTIGITTYHSIPGEWQGVYNEYVWAADNVLATNEPVYSLCQAGGGSLIRLNYTVARTGVLDSVSRLIAAIATANAMLGQ